MSYRFTLVLNDMAARIRNESLGRKNPEAARLQALAGALEAEARVQRNPPAPPAPRVTLSGLRRPG